MSTVKKRGVLRCGIDIGIQQLVDMFGDQYGIDMFIDEGFVSSIKVR